MVDESIPQTGGTYEGVSEDRARSRWPAWMAQWPASARVAVVALALLIACVGLAVGADVALSLGKVHPGVHVGAVKVGGMSTDEAARAIEDYVAKQAAEPVVLAVGDDRWDVEAESIGLSVDATGLARSAYEVGRGEFLDAVSARARAFVTGVTVPLELKYDETAVAQIVENINAAVAEPPVDASIVIEGATVKKVPAEHGRGVTVRDVRDALLEAFLSNDHMASLELVALPPKIDEKRAEAAYEAARTMVSGPLVLYYEDKEWTIQPEAIGKWIGFRSVSTSEGPILEAYVVPQDVAATVLPLVSEVGRPAKDASFRVSNGAVTILPSQDGLAADVEDLTTRLESVLASTGKRRAELTMRRVEPELTTEEARGLGIVERLSTFTTEFSSADRARVNNIHRLADALDGTLIPPGGTFSFNGTVGERTAAKGYQEAPAIVDGKLVPQLGGGICQVNTTLFNAVFFSGLPVIERHNHSQYISHYPKGRDATVSWGGPDLKFKNDTRNWILVATSYTDSSITVSLYGTDPGYEVSYSTGPFTDLVDPPVREVKDPTLPAGTRIVEERGASGRTIVVTRVVKKNGAEIRRDSFKSVYRPKQQVVRVGTKPVAANVSSATAAP